MGWSPILIRRLESKRGGPTKHCPDAQTARTTLAEIARTVVPDSAPDRVVFELDGSEADNGMPLANLEAFIDQIIRGLRAFDRHTRLERGLKTGHPTKRDELLTAFRVVELKAGSTTITLEPEAPSDEDEQLFPDASTLAIANVDAFIASVGARSAFDPDAAAAISRARRALGDDGLIRMVHTRGERTVRKVAIDAKVERRLEKRARRMEPRPVRVSGRLHLIDLEPPYRVGIRASDGTEWLCRYPPNLENRVKGLLDARVWAKGVGNLTGAQRGSLEISDIQPVASGLEQTEMFTLEPVALEDLMLQQGISGPTAKQALVLSAELSDEEIEGYLAVLIDE